MSRVSAPVVLLIVASLVAGCASSGGASTTGTSADAAGTPDRTADASTWLATPAAAAMPRESVPTVRTTGTTDSGSRYASSRDPFGRLAVETDPLSGIGRVADAGPVRTTSTPTMPPNTTTPRVDNGLGFPPPSPAGGTASSANAPAPPRASGPVRSSADLPAPFAPPPPPERKDR